jgi:hypothetical protein
MKDRCFNKKQKYYADYGGRGITVCEQWQGKNGFVTFKTDMGLRPSTKHSLDRFPNKDGNYEPGNCRWATAVEQNRNRRNNRILTFAGKSQCTTEWAEETGIKASTIEMRLARGWTIEKTLTIPTIHK